MCKENLGRGHGHGGHRHRIKHHVAVGDAGQNGHEEEDEQTTQTKFNPKPERGEDGLYHWNRKKIPPENE